MYIANTLCIISNKKCLKCARDYSLISIKLVLLFISGFRKMMIEQTLPKNPHNPMSGITTVRVPDVIIGNFLENSANRNCKLVLGLELI